MTFSDIFDLPNHAQDCVHWEVPDADLNDSADRMFARLERVFEVLRTPGFVFFDTIQLDVEAGRFPEVVAAYFRHPAWEYSQRFCIDQMCNPGPAENFLVGRLTFEVRGCRTADVIGQDGGYRWGPNLQVGGVQIPDSEAGAAIRMSPFDPVGAGRLEHIARAAWAAGRDMDTLTIWVPEPDIRARIEALD